MTNNKEMLPNKVAQVEVADVNEDKMVLAIKHFKTTLKGRNEYTNKNKSRESRARSAEARGNAARTTWGYDDEARRGQRR